MIATIVWFSLYNKKGKDTLFLFKLHMIYAYSSIYEIYPLINLLYALKIRK